MPQVPRDGFPSAMEITSGKDTARKDRLSPETQEHAAREGEVEEQPRAHGTSCGSFRENMGSYSWGSARWAVAEEGRGCPLLARWAQLTPTAGPLENIGDLQVRSEAQNLETLLTHLYQEARARRSEQQHLSAKTQT